MLETLRIEMYVLFETNVLETGVCAKRMLVRLYCCALVDGSVHALPFANR